MEPKSYDKLFKKRSLAKLTLLMKLDTLIKLLSKSINTIKDKVITKNYSAEECYYSGYYIHQDRKLSKIEKLIQKEQARLFYK